VVGIDRNRHAGLVIQESTLPSFSTLKMRTKLILIAAIPLLGLLYFSISSIIEKASVSREMGKLESLVGLSVKIGDLAHELQKERGMTAGFLGSQGVKFSSELPTQRAVTDKKIGDFKQELFSFNADQFGAQLKNSLGEVSKNIEGLGAKRSAVSALGIPAPEALGYYTKTIGSSLDIPSQVSTLSSDSYISRLASSYIWLLQAKERAGQERAVLAGVFASDKFAPGLFVKFLSISSSQEVYVSIFNSYAIDDQKAFYKNKISGSVVDEVNVIKKTAIENAGEKSLGIDSAKWFKAATDKINLLKEVEDKLSGDLLQTAGKLKSGAQALMVFYIVLAALLLLITLFIAVYIIRGLLRQIGGEPDYAAEAVHKISAGDLSTDLVINAGDSSSLLYSMKVMQDNLRSLISEIKDSTDTIHTAAKEISAGNSDLSQRTEEQASSLEETASSMEELTSTVKQNAENAKHANQLAIAASGVAGKGGAVVGQVVGTMDSINESSRKIVDIISVIDGIAFQTNILALNAAVEAARAGEQGRGFAVVASEVRNLAQRSAAAAKEIKTLIGDSVEKVEGGSKLVAQAGQTMEEIVTSIHRVTDIMSEITIASAEQSQGIEQINQAITQMDEVTQQNAALVEEAAAAAESLEEQSQNLLTSVSTFKVDDNATRTVARAPASVSRQTPAPVRKAISASKSSAGKTTAVAKPKAKPGNDDEWQEF
jgi:methyl-accepting chemotaxis protein